jgi:hypothetical protein
LSASQEQRTLHRSPAAPSTVCPVGPRPFRHRIRLAPFTQVTIADRQGADTVYWVDFTVPNPTTPPTQATVSIKKPKASPGFWSETQKVIDLSGGGFYIQPFSIPQEGGSDAAGKYAVRVTYNEQGGTASCSFTAVEPSQS